jgi:hypothetical protein
MRFQILFLLIILSFLMSCGGSPETTNRNMPNGNTTANVNKAGGNPPLGTNVAPDAGKTGEAATLNPVVQGYYEALKKKDEAGAKKYLSAAALKYYETEAKTEKKTWFAYVIELEEPLDEKREVRNEKIEGEKAVAEIKGGSLARFTPVAFVKENGEWKFASQEETTKLSNLKKTETLSNTAK